MVGTILLLGYFLLTVVAAVVAAVKLGNLELGFLLGIAGIVLGGVFYFVGWFVLPWRRDGIVLRTALAELAELGQRAKDEGSDVTDLARISEILSADLLIHAWTEFEDTLHPQEEGVANEFGQHKIVRYRQTVPAEVYFSQSALIEVPLRTEFFKHLPGMLTGLGIIGTFAGIIAGLKGFDATGGDPESTTRLIQSVYYAFFISLFAIVGAIGITIVEKFMINRRVGQAAEMCDALDRLFDAGAGEEYLARLVQSSEEGAAQTTQLKDALVAEITEVLERMTKMQIEALRQGAIQQGKATKAAASIIADEMARQIKDTFEEPLKLVAESISATNQSTQEQVGTVLHDLLAQFSSQVESMFGNQMEELAGLLQETSTMMQTTVSRLDGLADAMEGAGEKAVSSMGEAMQAQIAGMAMQLGTEMSRVLTDVQSATAALQTNLLEGQEQLNAATQSTIEDLTQQIAVVNEGTGAATEAMRTTVTALTESTQEAMESFEASTRRLETSVSQIYEAGSALAANLSAASEIVEGLTNSTKVSASALEAAKKLVEDMGSGTSELTEALGTVREILSSAERDASVTTDLVRGIETSAKSLAAAQSRTEAFLSGLEDALVKAHDDFSRQVDKSLDATAKVFHQDLEKATKQLSGVVKELGDVLDEALEGRDSSA